MKINIAKSSGFCFGVKRAIEISSSLACPGKKVYVLGDIVHNSFVVEDLRKKGIKKIEQIRPMKNATLIIRAHGAGKSTFLKAEKCGFKIVDATCPKVKEIYKIARQLEKSHRIIIIGDAGHDEVKGIAGQLEHKPIVVESPGTVPFGKLRNFKKAAVITQSTQTLDNINSTMDVLRSVLSDVELYNTTCRTTHIKQEEINRLPRNNDVVLIIGSKTSANTKRLFQISRKINNKTYWIESSRGLRSSWLTGARSVGIMAGASTPDKITDAVVKKLKSFGNSTGKRPSRQSAK
ncbi:MAG: 4-hydroxy-3-methylbut-2-enyl diphosphate reductase [Candidatus Omnitrophica bacterium]|nr:4-hydroxy-3-methylbut-2-enyl diphosphate reductase [Candidatus Omnitrophota bacterium]